MDEDVNLHLGSLKNIRSENAVCIELFLLLEMASKHTAEGVFISQHTCISAAVCV